MGRCSEHGRGSGWDLQRAGRQVSVLVLQLAIQRQATLLPVVGQERRQCENLAEGGAGSHQVTADRGEREVVAGTAQGLHRTCTGPRPGLGQEPEPRPRVSPGPGARLVVCLDSIAKPF